MENIAMLVIREFRKVSCVVRIKIRLMELLSVFVLIPIVAISILHPPLLVSITILMIALMVLHFPQLYETYLAKKVLDEAMRNESDSNLKDEIKTIREDERLCILSDPRQAINWIKQNESKLSGELSIIARKTIKFDKFRQMLTFWIVSFFLLTGLLGSIFAS